MKCLVVTMTSFLMCLREPFVSILASSIITHVLYGLMITVISTQPVSSLQIQPANFSIDGFVDSNQVRLVWSVSSFEGIARFILVHKEQDSNSRTITEIEPEYTVHTLKDLKELTTYLVYLETVYKNGTTIRSDVISFDTPEADYIIPPSRGGKRPERWRPGKIVVLCIVGILWISLIVWFFKQWGIIRMFLPYAARISYNQETFRKRRKTLSRRFEDMRLRRSKKAPPVVILETDVDGGTRAVMDTTV
ncbi:fibronectin type III domain-containing protein 5b-like isoform X2 [Amphiura filiformis]|uniref:fibronectin type III domain-containing protein 5b-like isoform X2 n=1 Tax=Amphiura filiformis TaxID=82378 RepID=UPI003B20D885